ncbi:quinone oxidoreductase [Elasticomyces elasticus]|nr:quinone oxidoreductase [Elasticomyces elasticus]
MVKARQWILEKMATDLPTIDISDANFKLVEKNLPDPKDDELLHSADRSPPKRIFCACTSCQSRTAVRCTLAATVRLSSPNPPSIARRYGRRQLWMVRRAPDLGNGMSRTLCLSAFGTTAITAYFGLTEVAQITKDDIVVVSGAAGATGSMCVQLVKKLVGCKKFIGIAGTDDKCKWVEKLGADICLSYKSTRSLKRLDDNHSKVPILHSD